MRKYFYTSSFLIILFFSLTDAKVNADAINPRSAILFTLITHSTSAEESIENKSQLLYLNDEQNNSISFFKVENDLVSAAINMSLKELKNEWQLKFTPIYADQEQADTIKLRFNDNDYSINISGDNGEENYILYPSFYAVFKKNVQHDKSTLAVLSFLKDNIGGNLANDIYPWLWFGDNQKTHKQIKSGYVVTKRSQADNVKDNWNVRYDYRNDESLKLINVTSKDQTHFKKKINYSGKNITSIEIFQNLEDRQITERNIIYKNGLPLRWIDHIVETGKNRETDFNAEISRKNIIIGTAKLSKEEVLNLAHDE